MFCPEGYKTIQEVRNSVTDFSWLTNTSKDRTKSDAFEALVFDTILDNDALRICSPQGVVMKVSDEILDRINILEFIDAEHFPREHFYDLFDYDGEEKRWAGMPLFFERGHYTILLKSYREYKKVALKVFNEADLWEASGLCWRITRHKAPLAGVSAHFAALVGRSVSAP